MRLLPGQSHHLHEALPGSRAQGQGSQTESAGQAVKSLSMAQLKMAWGFLLLAGILTLCARIALGHVEQGSSYGLTEIIGILAVLAGQ